MDDFLGLLGTQPTATSKSSVLYESKVDKISVEIKENIANAAELNKLHEILQNYDSHGKKLTSCVNNSRAFSDLFSPYSFAIPHKTEGNVAYRDDTNKDSGADTEFKNHIAALRNKVDNMSSIDDMLAKVQNDQKDKYDVDKKIHKALQPTRYELARAHWKRRQRNRARIVLGRFFNRCALARRRQRAAQKICKCFLFYLRVIKLNRKATVIQCFWRSYLARKRCASVRMAAALITKQAKKAYMLSKAKQKVRDVVKKHMFCIKIQSRLRGIRGRRLVQKLRQDHIEQQAALKIQNFYWSTYGGTRLEALAEQLKRNNVNDDDVMILREIMRPNLITDAIGKWVLLSERDDEGLIEDIDVERNMLVVLFGEVEDAEEYEIPFKSTDIVMWYNMSSKAQQAKEEHAARIMQRAIRYRLARTHMYFNRPVSKKPIDNSTLSKFHGKNSPSEGEFRKCQRPKLNTTVGFFVESPAVPQRKGLVEMFDLQQNLIRVVYQADDFLFEKIYDYSDNLRWYKKNNSDDNAESGREMNIDGSGDSDFNINKSNYRGRITRQRMQLAKERDTIATARKHVPPLTAFHKSSRPPLDSAPGFWVLSRQEAFKDTPGFVLSVDETRKELKVDFSFGHKPPVAVHFTEKGLKWCNPESYSHTEPDRGPDSEVVRKPKTSQDEASHETYETPSDKKKQVKKENKPKQQQQLQQAVEESSVNEKGGGKKLREDKEDAVKKLEASAKEVTPEQSIMPDHSVSKEGDASGSVSGSDGWGGSINKDIFVPTTTPTTKTSLTEGNLFILISPNSNNEEDGDEEEEEIGKVLSLNFKNGMASVHFINSASTADDIKYDQDVEEVPFLAHQIQWLELAKS